MDSIGINQFQRPFFWIFGTRRRVFMPSKAHLNVKFALQRKYGSIQKFAYQENLNASSLSRIIQGWMKPPEIYRTKMTRAIGKKLVDEAFGEPISDPK